MEKRLFKTLIRKDHKKYGGNVYVEGRISGIGLVLCEDGKPGPSMMIEEGIVQRLICTPEQYEKFANMVEERYPGLCEFDYHYKKES